MKILTYFLSVILFVSIFTVNESDAQVQVTGSISVNGNYPTLSAAFTAINGVAQTGANVLLTVNSNTSEPVTGAVLNSGAWASLRIHPSAVGLIVSANVNPGLPLIDLNGADKVHIDGVNIANDFTFSNTSTSSTPGTSTIRFQSDAVNNTVGFCKVLGSATMGATTDGGTIWFGRNSTTTGNDNNVIEDCDIGSALPSSNLPTKGICSIGTSNALNNSGDTIRNCNIYNYFSNSVSSSGVYLGFGTTGTTITNNKFYMESLQSGGSSITHSAIWIDNTSGNNFMISGNTIGYSSSSTTGTYSINGGSLFNFNAITLNSDTTVASNIQNNIIRNISLTTSSGSAPFKGIYIINGMTNITGNTIGDQTSTGSLSFTAPNAEIVMIYVSGNASVTCSNNNIGSVNINLSAGATNSFLGIRVSMFGSPTFTCQNNIIGGTAGNSINVASTTHLGSFSYGIFNTSSASTISGNTIRNITCASGIEFGIAINASSTNHTLSQNLIYNLKNTNVTEATSITGIQFLSSTGTNIVSRNFIHNNFISNNNASLTGIQVLGGTATYQNNMISLGSDTSGSGVNSGATIRGIYETSGSNSIYFNSVYIGGSPTSGSNNTFAFSSTVLTSTRNYRDNIFYNARSNSGSTGKHYAVTIAGTAPNPAGLTINNNIYFTSGTGGVFGLYNGADIASLTAWKAATGQDAGSYQDNPNFFNPAGSTSGVNLHLNPSLATIAEGSGFIIVSITDDYDGQTRSSLTPVDIGADAGDFLYFVEVSNAIIGKGKYLNLTSAFAVINSAMQTSANIIIKVGVDITEPSTGAVLNNNTWTSMIIQPNTSGINISANVNDGLPLIDLNGADNVSISGIAASNNFTFTNTSTSSDTGTSTIRFRNDAVNNKINFCVIEGSSKASFGIEGGVVSFGTSPTGVTGCDNNVISDCTIKPAGSNLPVKAISFIGSTTTTALNSSSDTIKNCDIKDYFSPTEWSAGIHILEGNTNIGIINNNFFQTAARTQTIGTDHSGIKIDNPSGNNFFVSGNKIGSETFPEYILAGVSGTKFYGIYIASGTSGASTVQNNTFKNILYSGALAGTGVSSPFAGIFINGGLANLSGNTIGSMSSSEDILIVSNSPVNSDMLAIYMTGVGTNYCNNNNIGGIKVSNESTGQIVFYCIRASNTGAATATLQNNIIGGTNINSIENATNGASTRSFGIHTDGPTTTMTGNIIRNITSAGGTGTLNLSSVNGININNPASKHTISQNQIYDLKNTNTSAACVVNGIYFSSTAGTSTIEQNFIHNLMISGSSSSINGIYANAGIATFKNNMISLGLDVTGNSITGGALNGIREFGGTNNFYFNSVYMGGNPNLGAANTFAFNSSVVTNTRDFRNNIFFNNRSNIGSTGKHYSVRVGGTAPNPAGLTINNNVYLANGIGGVFGLFNGIDVANLSAWKTAVGQDAGSFEANPQFYNPASGSASVDLHINPLSPTIVEANGFNIVSVTDDYDGQTRSTLTPVDIGADAGNFTPLIKTLNLTMFIQGFYNSGTNAMVADTVRVYFRNALSPYAILDSSKAFVSSSGTGTFLVSNIINGAPYYIQLKHRNSLETWSDSPKVFVSNSLTFNFTTSSSKAYGSNMPSIDASPVRFGIYSGDVNQEGNVDLSDVLLVYNDAGSFVTGYVKTDVNGDNITDLSDIIITYNNASGFVVKETP